MRAIAPTLALAAAAAGLLAAAPCAGATLRLLAPVGAVSPGDRQGAPDATPVVRVVGHREPGDPTAIQVLLKPMIGEGSTSLAGSYRVKALVVPDGQRTFAVTVTRGDLRAAGLCDDPDCTTAATTVDAWQPDPYRIVATGPGGAARTAAPGGLGVPLFQETGDAATSSARIGRGGGGFVEITSDLAGGGPNFAADHRPLPTGGGGAFLGAWYAEAIAEGGEALASAAGPGQGFAQRHVVRRDGSILVEQSYRLARGAGAGADAGLRLTRAIGVAADATTYRITDSVRNATSRRRTVDLTYRVRAYAQDDPIWTLSWLGRRWQRSNGRTALPRPAGPGWLLVRPESAGPFDAAHGWAAYGQRPLRARFASAAFADGTLLVTFRVVVPARGTARLRLAAGVVGDPAVGRARARAELARLRG